MKEIKPQITISFAILGERERGTERESEGERDSTREKGRKGEREKTRESQSERAGV